MMSDRRRPQHVIGRMEERGGDDGRRKLASSAVMPDDVVLDRNSGYFAVAVLASQATAQVTICHQSRMTKP
jgi:hypothetical protein